MNIYSQIVQINQQVEQLYQQGQYKQALSIAAEAYELADQFLGKNHLGFADCLNNLARLYHTMGDYPKAEPLYLKALEIRRIELGDNSPNFATSLDNLAMLYYDMADYVKAAPLFAQSLEIRFKVLSADHPHLIGSMNNMAKLLSTMGDYTNAESMYELALMICQSQLLEKDEPEVVASLMAGLGRLYHEMGDYVKAESLYRQSLGILDTKDHPLIAMILTDLARLYSRMRDFAMAEALHRQALEIRQRAANDLSVAQSLNNLAGFSYRMKNYREAELVLRQNLEVFRNALGEDHPAVADNLNNLALVYQKMGDYNKAESLYLDALEIRQRIALKEDEPEVAISLYALGRLYHEMGDYVKAEPLYRQALEIQRKALEKDHPDLAISLHTLAGLYAATNREAEAIMLMKQTMTIQGQMIEQVFSIGSERQRMKYLKDIQSYIDIFLSLVQQFPSQTSVTASEALDLVLKYKALGIEALVTQRNTLRGGQYPTLEPTLQKLTDLQMQIARKTLAGSEQEDVDSHQQALEEWIIKKDRLEAELARQIPEMSLEKRLLQVDLETVAKVLPEKTALIEFVRFNVFDFKAVPARGESQRKPARYLAFVIPAGEPEKVEMIDLGEAEPIDNMITAFRDSVIQEGERGVRNIGVVAKTTDVLAEEEGIRLKRALFEPLLPALQGYERLFLAPDGDLARLPFEILPLDDVRWLIDEYHINYLGAGRDILRFGQTSTRQPAIPLVVADPDFDLGKETEYYEEQQQDAYTSPQPKRGLLARLFRWRKAESQIPIEKEPQQQVTQVPSESSQTPPVHASSSRHSRELDESHIHFEFLKGTHIEGEHIGDMLDVQPWFGGHALEAKLKASRSPRILHIATHGFFLTDQGRDPNTEMRGFRTMGFKGFSETGFVAGTGLENPLLRSGLALAGANTFLQKGNLPPDAEDGLLTAEDVTGLDLLDTELVVLSACETGLGEVHVGEGVFGLRRSFVIAGAKTLVMSLWKVPDEQTQELMVDFYRRLLKGEGRADALRNAQLAMKAKYPHPFYWGAFICQGDPAPLPSR